ncbi:unnamed protein product [Rotaria sp. Silwood1]|nr:unnamed protein product [Rotaria sp. Silwood1]
MNGIGDLHGWQWIFILISAPIIILAIITFFFLENISDTIRWLTPAEREILTNILRDSTEQDVAQWHQVFHVFIDRKIWLFAVVTVGCLAVTKYWIAFFPSLIDVLGFKNAEGQLMSIPPYVLAWICALLGVFSVTRKKEHGYHVIFFLIISSIGFILMAALEEKSRIAVYVGACVACCGVYSAFPLLMGWLASYVSGHMKRALAIGFVVGLGQIGGIVLPHFFHSNTVPVFRQAHITCAVIMVNLYIRCLVLDNLNNLCLFKINDRSLVSHCDCEFCIVTNDLEEEKDGRFNGKPIRVEKFSSSWCKKIFQMLLGIQFDNYNNIEVTDPI